MNESLILYLLTAAFGASALLFTLPRRMMGPFKFAYPAILGVFALAFIVLAFACPVLTDKLIATAMLIVTAFALENRVERDDRYTDALSA